MKHHLLLVLVMFTVVACGGGGGGGNDGRTTETAVRIVHAALDATPVTIRVGEDFIQTARFAQVTEYVPVDSGSNVLILERANTALPVGDISFEFAEDTEYTLFLFGEVLQDSFQTSLIEDIVSQPEEGFGNVRLMNGLAGVSQLRLSQGGSSLTSASLGSASSFQTVVSGPQSFSIVSAEGDLVSQIDVIVPERGELTIVVAGSSSLGVVFVPIYTDLD